VSGAEPLLALSRGDVASYVSALFTVYIVLIFIRILSSWIPRMPQNTALLAVINFSHQTTDPYLNVFRRMLPPVGGSGLKLDLSPMIGLFLLLIGQTVIVGAIGG
jgi:YggT family protein